MNVTDTAWTHSKQLPDVEVWKCGECGREIKFPMDEVNVVEHNAETGRHDVRGTGAYFSSLNGAAVPDALPGDILTVDAR